MTTDLLLPGMPERYVKVTAPPAPELTVHKSALLSPDGAYRYTLRRSWTTNVDPAVPARILTWLMLNPSRADATDDDRTIGRCVEFARRWGYDAIDVVNLYAFRATKPAVMFAAADRGVDTVGPENDYHLTAAVVYADRHDTAIVAAWGVNARPDRVAEVLALPFMGRLMCLGVTVDGHPRHPLFVKGDTPLEVWHPAA